jgi:hypothetical protein
MVVRGEGANGLWRKHLSQEFSIDLVRLMGVEEERSRALRLSTRSEHFEDRCALGSTRIADAVGAL